MKLQTGADSRLCFFKATVLLPAGLFLRSPPDGAAAAQELRALSSGTTEAEELKSLVCKSLV